MGISNINAIFYVVSNSKTKLIENYTQVLQFHDQNPIDQIIDFESVLKGPIEESSKCLLIKEHLLKEYDTFVYKIVSIDKSSPFEIKGILYTGYSKVYLKPNIKNSYLND